ncbi:MAG: 50S ribosomal protein L30 [Thermoplasmatales archaeon]|jgi:large subunit ribosomal protein L30|nr:50S ribosomal protein L30 [Thermoplasmatales archaeon]MCK4416168.1 50S ribosomal protein L30 [Thermoplasmatales archaeon]
MVFAVIRVRGIVNVKPDIKRTLELLRLTKVNHCVLLEENKVYKGMLQIAKDYTTWGEINKEILSNLINSRGMLVGDKRITEEYVKSATSYDSIEKLSQAIIDNKFKYNEIPEIKPLFRLSPPKKGYEGIKRSFTNGGALGYRGKEINKLLERTL